MRVGNKTGCDARRNVVFEHEVMATSVVLSEIGENTLGYRYARPDRRAIYPVISPCVEMR
jgi:hypothetical protein